MLRQTYIRASTILLTNAANNLHTHVCEGVLPRVLLTGESLSRAMYKNACGSDFLNKVLNRLANASLFP